MSTGEVVIVKYLNEQFNSYISVCPSMKCLLILVAAKKGLFKLNVVKLVVNVKHLSI